MRKIIIKLIAAFILDKQKRKAFRKKYLWRDHGISCFAKYDFPREIHKKDIGLVGLWGNVNYGSVLTNFATYKFIKDYGKSVLLIERPINSIEVPYVGNIFHTIPYPPSDVSPQYNTIDEMCELNQAADTFIVNSDILYGEYSVRVFSQFMLLDYIDNSKNKYAYAASFGFDKFLGTEDLRKKEETSLHNFKKFTVREKSGIDVAKNYFNISSELVLDPLFLCNIRHFKSLAKNGKALLQGGIGCYILDTIEHDGLKIVDDVSQHLNLQNCVISDYQNPKNRIKNVRIEDWLATYFASDFIITDSFHGTCMAIILKKPFITIANVRRGLTRFESILELAGLRDHLVFDFEEYVQKRDMLLNTPIDWSAVSYNMRDTLNHSKEILRNMINSK